MKSFKTIYVIPNKSKFENKIKLELTELITCISRLKNLLLKNTNIDTYHDDIRFFNSDGIELDSTDIEQFENNQIIYFSTENQPFDEANYYDRYGFETKLKSVKNYSESYEAKDLLTNKQVYLKSYSIANTSIKFKI